MIRVEGYCPMGCGETLQAEEGRAVNRIVCWGSECPRPLAAQEVLSDSETGHVVRFRTDGFTVRHPLWERLGKELFDCVLHQVCASLERPPNNQPGTYRARLEDGALVLSATDEAD